LDSVGVDKTLLYSSRIQTTCARKHNEASQGSYLTAWLAGGFINNLTRLTMKHTSTVAAETLASSLSFAMLEATTCKRFV